MHDILPDSFNITIKLTGRSKPIQTPIILVSSICKYRWSWRVHRSQIVYVWNSLVTQNYLNMSLKKISTHGNQADLIWLPEYCTWHTIIPLPCPDRRHLAADYGTIIFSVGHKFQKKQVELIALTYYRQQLLSGLTNLLSININDTRVMFL